MTINAIEIDLGDRQNWGVNAVHVDGYKSRRLVPHNWDQGSREGCVEGFLGRSTRAARTAYCNLQRYRTHIHPRSNGRCHLRTVSPVSYGWPSTEGGLSSPDLPCNSSATPSFASTTPPTIMYPVPRGRREGSDHLAMTLDGLTPRLKETFKVVLTRLPCFNIHTPNQ